MRVIFRVDASCRIGTGHVMRCLSLAHALRELGADVIFICRDFEGNLKMPIRQQGFKVLMLPATRKIPEENLDSNEPAHLAWLGVSQLYDAEQTSEVIHQFGTVDWLVADHYALDNRWEAFLRSKVKRIAVVDDLADRLHDCDLLLDQTYGRSKADYAACVPPNAHCLLGPTYALLRPEFRRWRAKAIARRQRALPPEQLLISLGGVDAGNTTSLVLRLLAQADLPPSLKVSVVVGATSPHQKRISAIANHMSLPTEICIGISNMAELMASADLAIGAGGATSWERCCLGLPTVVISVAQNQHLIAEQLHSGGMVVHAGTHAEIEQEPERLIAAVQRLLKDWQYRTEVSSKAAAIVDGCGAERVARILFEPRLAANPLSGSS